MFVYCIIITDKFRKLSMYSRSSFCVKMKNTLLSAGQSTTPVTETPRGRQSYGATDSIHSDEGGSIA